MKVMKVLVVSAVTWMQHDGRVGDVACQKTLKYL
jgi:hypothetical protein